MRKKYQVGRFSTDLIIYRVKSFRFDNVGMLDILIKSVESLRHRIHNIFPSLWIWSSIKWCLQQSCTQFHGQCRFSLVLNRQFLVINSEFSSCVCDQRRRELEKQKKRNGPTRLISCVFWVSLSVWVVIFHTFSFFWPRKNRKLELHWEPVRYLLYTADTYCAYTMDNPVEGVPRLGLRKRVKL